jgi:hypothetical protein
MRGSFVSLRLRYSKPVDAMACVNHVDEELAQSLIEAVGTIHGWPLPRHEPPYDPVKEQKAKEERARVLEEEKKRDKEERKTKTKKEREKLKADREKADADAKAKEAATKRAEDEKLTAEIKKNAPYMKLKALADAKNFDELLTSALSISPKMQALSENGMALPHVLLCCRCDA